MNKECFLSLALAAAVTTAVSAYAYEPTYTNFLTGVSSVAEGGAITAVGGTWTTNGVSLTKVADKVVGFEATNTLMRLDVGTPGPADTNTIVRVELEVSLSDVGDLMASLPEGAQTAFAVHTNAYNVWDGSTWVALDEIPAGLEDAATTNLTVELCYQGTNTTRSARFFVGDTLLHLRSDGTTTLISLATTTNNFNGMGISGSGKIAKADAEVMLGVAEFEGVKYGTLTEAVAKAEEVYEPGVDPEPIDVLRATSENISISNNGVVIADHGKTTGTVTVPDNMQVVVQATEEDIGQTALKGASGEYEFPVKVSGKEGSVEVALPSTMSDKEIVPGSVTSTGTKVKARVQTAAKVLGDIKFDGKSITNNIASLRAFLESNSETTNEYVKAGATDSGIKTALETAGANGIPLYQSYELGITQADSVKPIPVASDNDSGNIKLYIPAVRGTTRPGDFTVKYKVGTGAAQELSTSDGAVNIPLTSGTGSYPIKIVFE